MMRSLFSGVSGLRTHQTRMDVIGNNIANVNTTAYKAKQMNFSDMLSQTTQAATGANAANGTGGTNPRQIGLGVKAAAINATITQEGANQTTGNPFDLKISGNAFFVVSDGTSTFYTRDGSFNVDDAGNLCMASTGYIVRGWGVDQDGNIVKGTVGNINTNTKGTYEAEATKTAKIAGIIDKDDIELQTANGKVVNVPIYDNAGYTYNLKFGILPSKDPTAEKPRTTTNVETPYAMPQNIYMVDTSKLTYTYDVTENGQTITKTLNTVFEPDMMQQFEEDIWAYAFDTTKNPGGAFGGLGAAHVPGNNKDVVTVTMKDYIAEKKLDVNALSDLQGLTIKVSFSGDTGFVKNTTGLKYPISDATKIDTNVVGKMYTAGTTSSFTAYTLGGTPNAAASASVLATSQTYVDDMGNSVTQWKFETVNNGAKVDLNIDSESTDAMKKLLGLGAPKGIVNKYETVQNMRDTNSVVKGEYSIELLGMTASDGSNVDISNIRERSKFNIVYDTGNGDFKYVGSDGNKAFTVDLSLLNTNGNFSAVSIDMSDSTNVSNEKKSTLEGKRLDGRQIGKLLGVSVGTDGILTASYSNGQSRAIGQICVAKFANAMGLENAGDNLYRTTANSGDASLVDIKAEGIGSITSGILEMSNVDLSQQFTDMITTQRGFQANSRIITTSDSLLEELVNLKR